MGKYLDFCTQIVYNIGIDFKERMFTQMIRLKELREESNKTMRQVADELNLPYTTYVNYEKGARKLPPNVLVKIASYYGTTVDYVLGESNVRFLTVSGRNEAVEFWGDKETVMAKELILSKLPQLDTKITQDICFLIELCEKHPARYSAVSEIIYKLFAL